MPNGYTLSRRGGSCPANASGVDAHRDSITIRCGPRGFPRRRSPSATVGAGLRLAAPPTRTPRWAVAVAVAVLIYMQTLHGDVGESQPIVPR
jgi:hypothetical protein